jgi:hypothetical protein
MLKEMPKYSNYGQYSNDNYGAHTLCFTDKEGNDYYYSYQTLVAFRNSKHGLVVHKNDWGTTTGKHLNWIDRGNKNNRVDDETFHKLLNEN